MAREPELRTGGYVRHSPMLCANRTLYYAESLKHHFGTTTRVNDGPPVVSCSWCGYIRRGS